MRQKKEREDLAKKFDLLQTSVDNYAKKADAYFEKMVAMNNAIKRHEKWIEQIAKQLNITLEY